MNSENLKRKSSRPKLPRTCNVYTSTCDDNMPSKVASKSKKERNPLATLCENSQLVSQNLNNRKKRTASSTIVKEVCVTSKSVRSKSAGGLSNRVHSKSEKITFRARFSSQESDDDSEEVFVPGETHYVNFLACNSEKPQSEDVRPDNAANMVQPLPVVRASGEFSQGKVAQRPATKVTLAKKLGRRCSRFRIENIYLNSLYDAEYYADNYKYMLSVEGKFVYRKSLLVKYIDHSNRLMLMNWLIYVHQVLDLSESSLFITIRMLDYILITSVVPVKEYVLIALTCMWITSKVYESNFISVHKLFSMCSGKYSKCQFLSMEKQVLKVLDFKLNFPEPSTFLFYYLQKVNLQDNNKIIFGAMFLLEMFTLLFEFSSSSTSILASAALYLVLQKYEMDSTTFMDFVDAHLLEAKVFKDYSNKMEIGVQKVLKCKVIGNNEVVAKYSALHKLNVAQFFLP